MPHVDAACPGVSRTTCTQRWRERHQRWLPVQEGGFNAKQEGVEAISDTTAKAFVRAHHYSQSCPVMVLRYGMKEGIRGFVSFFDPVARLNARGETIFPGHLGQIYQLKEAWYTGRSEPRTLVLLPDGTVLHERTRQKIRAQETGHEEVEKRLHDLGAPLRQAWESPTQWLNRVLPSIHAHRVRHQGNHRYVFRLDRRIRREVRLPILPYPLR